jgi:hypothetical protein
LIKDNQGLQALGNHRYADFDYAPDLKKARSYVEEQVRRSEAAAAEGIEYNIPHLADIDTYLDEVNELIMQIRKQYRSNPSATLAINPFDLPSLPDEVNKPSSLEEQNRPQSQRPPPRQVSSADDEDSDGEDLFPYHFQPQHKADAVPAGDRLEEHEEYMTQLRGRKLTEQNSR